MYGNTGRNDGLSINPLNPAVGQVNYRTGLVPPPPPLVRHGLPQQQPQQPQSQFATSSFPTINPGSTYVQPSSAVQTSSPYGQQMPAHQPSSMYGQPRQAHTPSHVQQMPTLKAPYSGATSIAQHAQKVSYPYSGPGSAYQGSHSIAQQSFTGQSHSKTPPAFSGHMFQGQQQQPAHRMVPSSTFSPISSSHDIGQVHGNNRIGTPFIGASTVGMTHQNVQHSAPGNSTAFSDFQTRYRMPTTASHPQGTPLPAHQQKPSSLMSQRMFFQDIPGQPTTTRSMQDFHAPSSSFQNLQFGLQAQNSNVPVQNRSQGFPSVRSSAPAQSYTPGSQPVRHTGPQQTIQGQSVFGVNAPRQTSSHQGVQNHYQQHVAYQPTPSDVQMPRLGRSEPRPPFQGQNVRLPTPNNLTFHDQLQQHVQSPQKPGDDVRSRLINVLTVAYVCSSNPELLAQLGISERNIAYLKQLVSSNTTIEQSTLTQLGINQRTIEYLKHMVNKPKPHPSSRTNVSATPITPTPTTTVAEPPPTLPQDDAALIQSAFIIPQSSQCSEAPSRWYAPPSTTKTVALEEPRAPRNFSPHSISDIIKDSETVTSQPTSLPSTTNVSISSSPSLPTTSIFSVPPEINSGLLSVPHTDTIDKVLPSPSSTSIDDFNLTDSGRLINESEQRLLEANSILDYNKKRAFDELVLDSQYNSQDMDTDIDIRSFLPSPELPSEYVLPVSPINDHQQQQHALGSNNFGIHLETNPDNRSNQSNLQPPAELVKCKSEFPSLISQVSENRTIDSPDFNIPEIDIRSFLPPLDSPIDFVPNIASDNEQEQAPIRAGSDLETESTELVDTDVNSNPPVTEPVADKCEDEPSTLSTGSRVGEKRKHDSVGDDNATMLYSPPVKLARGRGRGRGFKRGRGRGGRGKWTVKAMSDTRTRFTAVGRKPSSKTTRGRGRGRGRKSATAVDTNHDAETPAKLTKLDDEVIQKPDDLKAYIDTFDSEELERHTVPLSTLKVILQKLNSKNSDQDQSIEDNSEIVTALATSKGEDNDSTHTERDCDKSDSGKGLKGKKSPKKTIPSEEKKMKSEQECSEKLTPHEGDCKSGDKPNEELNLKEGDGKSSDKANEELTPHEGDDRAGETHNEEGTSSDSKEKALKRKDRKDSDESSNQSYMSEDVDSSKNKKSASMKDKDLNSIMNNVTDDPYFLTDDHKITWVRYHNKIVTLLTTPDGNFFILKEILRRCFRIKEPNKSKQYKKIAIIKKEVLKIPDIKMESVFFDIVVRNLKVRQIIRTVPDYFLVISEENANRLFHYVCEDKYCRNGCVTPYYKRMSSKHSSRSPKSGKNQDKTGRNLFDIMQEETKPRQNKIKGKGLSSAGSIANEVINLCSDESDGYETDQTCPYVDGEPDAHVQVMDEHSNGRSAYDQISDTNNEDVNKTSGPHCSKETSIFNTELSEVDKEENINQTKSLTKHHTMDITGDEVLDSNTSKVTVDKKKKHLIIVAHSESETVEKDDIVQDSNVDSTDELNKKRQRCQKSKTGVATSVVESSKSGKELSDNITNEIDLPTRMNASGSCNEHNAGIVDSDDDVIIDEWTFPGPPKTYPEDGTKKLSEAHDTLMKIIDQANHAKNSDEVSAVLDKVFRITKPLKKWTSSLFDSYESTLLKEAQRIKSLEQIAALPESESVDAGQTNSHIKDNTNT